MTFSGLAENVRYVAYGGGKGVTFLLRPVLEADLTGERAPDRQRIRELEEYTGDVTSSIAVLQEAPINVRYPDFGAAGDGATDDSTAINAAVLAAAPVLGDVYLPPGEYRANVVARPGVTILGAGPGSVLKAPAGSNADVVKGVDFATLTGKTKATGDYALGAPEFELRDLVVDGDKANQSSGWGVRLWGRAPRLKGVVVIRNCKSGGLWTEFTDVDSFADSEQIIEGSVDFLSIQNCDGHGWVLRGPHDTVVQKCEIWSCTGWAVRVEQAASGYNGGVYFRHLNFFLCANGAYAGGSLFEMHGGAITGDVGTGLEFSASSGGGKVRGVVVAGHATGIILRGASHQIDAQCDRMTDVAVELDGAINCRVDVHGSGNENVIKVTSEAGPNFITGLFDIGAEALLKAGSVAFNLGGRYVLRGYGSSNVWLNQFPVVSFPTKAAGDAANRSLFCDVADEVLKYKDYAGVLHSLY